MINCWKDCPHVVYSRPAFMSVKGRGTWCYECQLKQLQVAEAKVETLIKDKKIINDLGVKQEAENLKLMAENKKLRDDGGMVRLHPFGAQGGNDAKSDG